MIDKHEIAKLLREKLIDAQILVSGDDGRHFQVEVIYKGFENKTKLQQHRMVYNALGDYMREAIHALSIETSCPQ